MRKVLWMLKIFWESCRELCILYDSQFILIGYVFNSKPSTIDWLAEDTVTVGNLLVVLVARLPRHAPVKHSLSVVCFNGQKA
jgi:hypothetical protein